MWRRYRKWFTLQNNCKIQLFTKKNVSFPYYSSYSLVAGGIVYPNISDCSRAKEKFTESQQLCCF